MTQNAARIIAVSAIAVTGAIGRSAQEWRDEFAVKHFGRVIRDQKLSPMAVKEGDSPLQLRTQNKKSPKPVFEVHERETSRREYVQTLMQRNNANKLSELASVRIGMFGKLLDKPVKAPAVQELETA